LKEFNKMTYVSLRIESVGFLDLGNNGYTALATMKGTFATTKLYRGIKVKGKVVMPDSQSDEAIVEPKVILSKQMSMLRPDYNNRFHAAVQIEEDGSFEKTVPESCKLVVTASSANAAAFHKVFKIPKADTSDSEHELGEIKLTEGVKISGTVVNRDGKPVEGQVVQILHQVKGSPYMQNQVYGHDISDAEGKFELPPRAGRCTISLVAQANINNKLVKPKGKLLLTKPISLRLKVGQPTEEIEIRESKTWKIHGIVNFQGDKPNLNHYDTGTQSQAMVEVDDDGRFEYEVVDGISPYIIIYQSTGSGMNMARLTNKSVKEHGKHFGGSPGTEGQAFQLKKVKSDIGPLEFELVKHIPDPRTTFEQFFDWYYFGE